MMDFSTKVVAAPVHDNIPGKRIHGRVHWRNNEFVVKIGENVFPIKDWDDLSECKWTYALPTNTYYTPWHRRLYDYPEKPDRDVLAMTLRFWGKYRTDMTIYGKIVDGMFIEVKRHKLSILKIL
jgi:hypothetical protein